MFFLLPIGVDFHSRRYPVVTISLIGVNTLIYLLSLIASFSIQGATVHSVARGFWLIPAESGWYTYFSTWFVHAGFFHLAGNMIYLFLFGSCVEDLIGRWQFVIFYVIGGLAADFFYIAVAEDHFHSTVALGGASGAITACIAGFLVLLRSVKVNFKYVIFLFFRFWHGDFWLPGWLVISFWFLQDAAGLLLAMSNHQLHGGTAFGAHVGGFIGGLVAAFAFKFMPNEGSENAVATGKIHGSAAGRPAANEPADVLLFNDGRQIGPVSRTQVRQMLALGSLQHEALYWIEGMTEWRPIGELSEFS